MHKKLLVLSLIVLVLSAGFADRSIAQSNISTNATNPLTLTWYVSTLGNDSNNCTSPATPCASLQAAADKAGAGG